MRKRVGLLTVAMLGLAGGCQALLDLSDGAKPGSDAVDASMTDALPDVSVDGGNDATDDALVLGACGLAPPTALTTNGAAHALSADGLGVYWAYLLDGGSVMALDDGAGHDAGRVPVAGEVLFLHGRSTAIVKMERIPIAGVQRRLIPRATLVEPADVDGLTTRTSCTFAGNGENVAFAAPGGAGGNWFVARTDPKSATFSDSYAEPIAGIALDETSIFVTIPQRAEVRRIGSDAGAFVENTAALGPITLSQGTLYWLETGGVIAMVAPGDMARGTFDTIPGARLLAADAACVYVATGDAIVAIDKASRVRTTLALVEASELAASERGSFWIAKDGTVAGARRP